jgi:cyclopropane fatty-acyl-phospholipid synthase-like methyltransferase
MIRKLPPTASVAELQEDGRLFAPSAANNEGPILSVLTRIAPKTGRALELASGTGQHIAAFARSCPGLIWVPTDVDEARLASISAYVQEAQLTNLGWPIRLDATQEGWAETTGPLDQIVLINLLHLISDTEARRVVDGIAAALAPGGKALIYGPFKRSGALTSEGDERFDASLREADPQIGYKDDRDVIDWLGKAGAPVVETIEMPANNLAIVCVKPE